jgi:tol-pal system protein YbgF
MNCGARRRGGESRGSVRCRVVALIAFLLVGGLASVAPAWAQGDAGALLDRLERMEREMLTLQRNVYRGDAPPPAAGAAAIMPPAAAAGLQVRITELEQEIRGLTGQVEQIGFQVRQLGDRLDRLVTDIDFRLRSMEQGLAAASPPPLTQPAPGQQQQPTVRTLGQVRPQDVDAVRAGAPAPGAAIAPMRVPGAAPQIAGVAPQSAMALPDGTPEEQYDFAYGLLMKRDFVGAEAALRSFIEVRPEHRLSGNAQYWLGETYYVREDYLSAARSFAEGYTTYPQSDKAPSNLLKLGMSLDALGRRDDACITFARLREEYPSAAGNILSRGEREYARLGCP